MSRRYYGGWQIGGPFPAEPVTGQFVAKRNGVQLCAGSREGLERMIDMRNAEEMNRRHDVFRGERVFVAGQMVREHLGGRTA